MPNFAVKPCTFEDGAAIAINNMAAFWQDEAWVLIWTRVEKTLEHVTSQAVLRSPQNLLNNREQKRHQKVVDVETGKLVGYCRWLLPDDLGDLKSEDLWPEARIPPVTEEQVEKAKMDSDSADWAYDQSLDEVDKPMKNRKDELLEGKNYMMLDYLAVHPDYQGNGIGSMLVKSGLEQVEKLGFDCFVLAKNAGLGVYQRAGFKLLDQVLGDNSMYGGPGLFTWSLLDYKVKK